MTKTKLLWMFGLTSAIAVGTLQGCGGGDDDDSGTGGTAGSSTTTGGTASKGGSTSTTGGTSAGGKGGAASTGGTSSTGGSGTGGTSSTGGSGGSSGGTAGSGGTGGGGGVCDMYCSEDATVCASNFATDYSTAEACKTACMAFTAGTAADETGNTAYCRYNHVENAKKATGTDIALHCGHAGKTPTGQCQ